MERVYVGSDHAGFTLKEGIKNFLKKKGYEVIDVGNNKVDQDDDYPDFASKLGQKVAAEKVKGILACGSGQGMCIAANKIKGIRAVPATGIPDAKLSREHLDANVISFGGWNMSIGKASKILEVWLATPFSTSLRHKRRIDKIAKLDK